jgi:hypothetical protein
MGAYRAMLLPDALDEGDPAPIETGAEIKPH